jgi:hypothetical protein
MDAIDMRCEALAEDETEDDDVGRGTLRNNAGKDAKRVDRGGLAGVADLQHRGDGGSDAEAALALDEAGDEVRDDAEEVLAKGGVGRGGRQRARGIGSRHFGLNPDIRTLELQCILTGTTQLR